MMLRQLSLGVWLWALAVLAAPSPAEPLAKRDAQRTPPALPPPIASPAPQYPTCVSLRHYDAGGCCLKSLPCPKRMDPNSKNFVLQADVCRALNKLDWSWIGAT